MLDAHRWGTQVKEYTDADDLLRDIRERKAKFAALRIPVAVPENPPETPAEAPAPDPLLAMGLVIARYGADHEGCRLSFATEPEAGEEAARSVQAPAGMSIIVATAARYGLKPHDLISESRQAILCRARQEAMWLCARDTYLSYPVIGRIFGDRDHTTVIHAVRTENDRRGENVRNAGGVRSKTKAGKLAASMAANARQRSAA